MSKHTHFAKLGLFSSLNYLLQLEDTVSKLKFIILLFAVQICLTLHSMEPENTLPKSSKTKIVSLDSGQEYTIDNSVLSQLAPIQELADDLPQDLFENLKKEAANNAALNSRLNKLCDNLLIKVMVQAEKTEQNAILQNSVKILGQRMARSAMRYISSAENTIPKSISHLVGRSLLKESEALPFWLIQNQITNYFSEYSLDKPPHSPAPHNGQIPSISAPETKKIEITDSNEVIIKDTLTRNVLFILKGHTDKVNSVHFNSHNTLIVTGSRDTTARIWNAHNGMCLFTLKGHRKAIQQAYFNEQEAFGIPADIQVITQADDGDFCWKIIDGSLLSFIADSINHHQALFLVIAYKCAQEKKSLDISFKNFKCNCLFKSLPHQLQKTIERTIDLTEPSDKEKVKEPAQEQMTETFLSEFMSFGIFKKSPDSAVQNNNASIEPQALTTEDFVKCWTFAEEANNSLTFKKIIKDRFKNYASIQTAIKNKVFDITRTSTAALRDYAIPLLIDTCPAIKFWLMCEAQISNSKPLAPVVIDLKSAGVHLAKMSFDPNSTRLLVRGIITPQPNERFEYLSNILRVYDASLGTLTLEKELPSGWPADAFFNAQGNHIVTQTFQRVEFWDSVTGDRIESNDINSNEMTMRPQNMNITPINNHTSRIHDSAYGNDSEINLIIRLNPNEIDSAFTNKQRDKIVIVQKDGTTSVWDISTNNCLFTLTGPGSKVKSALFNQQGTLLLTISHDKKLACIWDNFGYLLFSTNNDEMIEDITLDENDIKVAIHTSPGIFSVNSDKTDSISIISIIKPETLKLLLNKLTLEQAGLLIFAYECYQKKQPLDFRKVPELLAPFEKLDESLKKALRTKLKVIVPVNVVSEDGGHWELGSSTAQHSKFLNDIVAHLQNISKLDPQAPKLHSVEIPLPNSITQEDFSFFESYFNALDESNDSSLDINLIEDPINKLPTEKLIKLATIADCLQVEPLIQICLKKIASLLLQHDISKPLDEFPLNLELSFGTLSTLIRNNPIAFIWLLKLNNEKDNSTDWLTEGDIGGLSSAFTLEQALLVRHLFSIKNLAPIKLEENTRLYELFCSLRKCVQRVLCKGLALQLPNNHVLAETEEEKRESWEEIVLAAKSHARRSPSTPLADTQQLQGCLQAVANVMTQHVQTQHITEQPTSVQNRTRKKDDLDCAHQ